MSGRPRERPPVEIAGDVVRIPLTQGKWATVSSLDAEVAGYAWCAVRRPDGRWYAMRRTRRPAARLAPATLLHREIAHRAGWSIDGRDVDHRDGNGLNCCRSNLRVATDAENSRNRKPHKTSRSGLKGVCWHRVTGKWAAKICVNYRAIHLGLFATPALAAAAYDAAARLHHGRFARTNFGGSNGQNV